MSFPRVDIGSLPDNVLLEIFDFYRISAYDYLRWWYTLVHVCRSWRYIVFESPLRLHLRLLCNSKTPVKKMLDVWPRTILLIVKELRRTSGGDNIMAALKHHDRVSEINLHPTCRGLRQLYKAMKKPYPVLTRLHLHIWNWKSTPVLRGTFLGGSAPRLKDLSLIGIPFPALPKFLPFFPELVDIQLKVVPKTGYISPESMATALSALTKLKFVYVGFESPASHSHSTNRPPLSFTCVVLPALTRMMFYGDSDYFEELVARIDPPAISVNRLFFD